MQSKIKMSSIQLSFIIIALLFSDFPIVNAASNAKQNSWLAFIIGMFIGLLLVTIYLLISKLHPGKNFIEILMDSFGKYLGTVFSVLYIWFFIHIASLTLRTFTEYMININYFETPRYFIMGALLLSIIYALRKGFEVVARVTEIFIPILIFSVIFLFTALFNQFNYDFFLPILKDGIKPVLNTGFIVGTTPFGELIVLLMIFPYLNKKKNMVKVTYLSIIIGSILLLSIVVRDLLLLGSNLISFLVFPPNISTALLPTVALEPFISINLLIAGTGSLCVYIHAATVGIGQLFNIDDNKTFIFPVAIIVIGISIWQFDSVSEMFETLNEVFSYYAIVFQAFIPLIVLIISYMKRQKNKSTI